jgi:hypothetical protein
MNRILDRLTLVYPSWTAFTEARADVSTKPQVEGATARVAAAEADPRATKTEAAPRRSRSRVRRARQGQGITERG